LGLTPNYHIISPMILTQTTPFTQDQVVQLKEAFDVYIKTVIDVKNQVCIAGMNMHYEGEKILLENGSNQSDIWGGGIDLETKSVDFNSFINIRPGDSNTSNEIQNPEARNEYEKLTKHFFACIYE
jgi:hypothetical protein